MQLGDEPPPRFAFYAPDSAVSNDDFFTLNSLGDRTFHVEQIPCWITKTTIETHEIIRHNLDRFPVICGKDKGAPGHAIVRLLKTKLYQISGPRFSPEFFGTGRIRQTQRIGRQRNLRRASHTTFNFSFLRTISRTRTSRNHAPRSTQLNTIIFPQRN